MATQAFSYSYKELMTKLIVAQEDAINLRKALNSAEDETIALTSRLNECSDALCAIYEIATAMQSNPDASREQLKAALSIIGELAK
jgi:hypothetical protein